MLVRRYLCLAAAAGALLAAFAVPLRAAEQRSTATVAHIKLHGDLDEAPVSTEPLFGPPPENFKSKLDRIKKAKGDTNVDCLYLQLDGVAIGWGKLDELRHALADFRSGGKKVYAYLETGDSKDYLLATACDEICLPEAGWLMLTGMRAEMMFYKDLFDKIGVKADMLQMGDFKGAAEPYTRSSMSPQLRKQMESVVDDYFDKSLVETIVQGRFAKKLTSEQVKKLIDGGPYTAKAAKEAGLIDRVTYPEQFQDDLKAALGAERVKVTKNYGQAKAEDLDLSNPFALFKLLAPPKTFSSSKPKVAVIYVTGVIATGKSMQTFLGGETCGSTTLVEAIRQAEQDRTVKAIVLRVDSPGGSALASDLIWNALVQCKKPVVASMGDTAASGGYYVSMAAKKIYAEPGTLTGSIGVVGGKLTLGGLFDKVGLKTDTITRGAHAGILSSTTPFSDSEREAMLALMKDVYKQFLTKALQGRNKAGKGMDLAALESLAGGRVWTGRQAKANNLVDELGTLNEAVAAAWEMAGQPKDAEPEWLVLPKGKSLIDTLLEMKADARAPVLDATTQGLLRLAPELGAKFRHLDALLRLRGEPVWVLQPCQVDVK
jgi:protease-4